MKLFKGKKEKNMENNETLNQEGVDTPKKKPSFTSKKWFKISVIVNIVVLVGIIVGFSGMAIIHQSDTNPSFCGTCHIMQNNVTSYLTSNHLDNVHMQANVECKECHDYNVVAEVRSGFNFVTGNYEINQNGDLPKQKYSDDMCFECHISYSYIAEQTAFLDRNPHENHNGQLHCNTCHISHGDQVDYCAGCHDNGGQQMVEDDGPRETTAE